MVIGILIALQINNWNQTNKERAIGERYLMRIHADLSKDNTHLQNKIVFAKADQEAYTTYLRSMYKHQTNRAAFVVLTSSVGWNADNLILEDKTYVEITNSGQLGFVVNESIRDMIMDYYRNYATADEHITEMNQTGINMFSDIYKKLIPYYDSLEFVFNEDNMKKSSDWKFINNPDSSEFRELQSVALFYYYKQTVFENYYQELNREAFKLKKAIESEIEWPLD